jgi:hypothetical protein
MSDPALHGYLLVATTSVMMMVSHRCYGFRAAKTYITALYNCLGNPPEPKLVHKFL